MRPVAPGNGGFLFVCLGEDELRAYGMAPGDATA